MSLLLNQKLEQLMKHLEISYARDPTEHSYQMKL